MSKIIIREFDELFYMLKALDETGEIEAKEYATVIGGGFLETVCAFSNEPGMGGGYILMGIKWDPETHSYVIKGVQDSDKLQQQIANLCRQNFSEKITPHVQVVGKPEGVVLVVYIPEAEYLEKPIFIVKKGLEKGAYRRIGSSNHVCSHKDLRELFTYRPEKDYDQKPVRKTSI